MYIVVFYIYRLLSCLCYAESYITYNLVIHRGCASSLFAIVKPYRFSFNKISCICVSIIDNLKSHLLIFLFGQEFVCFGCPVVHLEVESIMAT